MIRILAIAAAASALAVPVSAAAADTALDAFQSICWGNSGNYLAAVKAADSSGWKDTEVTVPDEEGVSVTDRAAREKAADNGGRLTLFVTRGLRRMSTGDLSVTTCKLSLDKADPGLLGDAKAWIGAAPDGGDATLEVYYVAGSGAKPDHIGKAGMNAALAKGGLGILKFQQDSDGVILVDQVYSK